MELTKAHCHEPPNEDFWTGWGGVLLAGLATSLSQGKNRSSRLRDMSERRTTCAGFELKQDAQVHIRALGAGGETGGRTGTARGDEMFAYAWIINAETRNDGVGDDRRQHVEGEGRPHV